MCAQNRSRCDDEWQVPRKLLSEQLGATELVWNGLGVPGRQPFLYIFQAFCGVSIFGFITTLLEPRNRAGDQRPDARNPGTLGRHMEDRLELATDV